MARSGVNTSSSGSLCSVVLAMILASLSLTPVTSGAKNSSSVLNGITNAKYQSQLVLVGCTFIFDDYRIAESVKTVLKPGAEKNISVDDYPGVKQVECDITMFANYLNLVYNMRAVVWFFNGPSQTRCRFEDNTIRFAILPNLNTFNQGTGMQWGFDKELLYTPKFITSKSTSASSANESSTLKNLRDFIFA